MSKLIVNGRLSSAYQPTTLNLPIALKNAIEKNASGGTLRLNLVAFAAIGLEFVRAHSNNYFEFDAQDLDMRLAKLDSESESGSGETQLPRGGRI